MKWSGWGAEGVSDEGKPGLAPFIERHLDLALDWDSREPR
jgi:hypothetical protein